MPPAESGCRPAEAEKRDLPDHPPSSAAKPKTGSAKRLACDNCRERKVRCNREQPVCGRCARLGHNCQYTTPARQNSSHSDVSRLLLTLHSRLQQTEARLALNAPLLDPKHGMNIEPAPNAVDFASFDFMDIQQQQQQQPPPPQQKSSQAPSSQPLTQPDLGYLDNFNLDDPMWQADMDAW